VVCRLWSLEDLKAYLISVIHTYEWKLFLIHIKYPRLGYMIYRLGTHVSGQLDRSVVKFMTKSEQSPFPYATASKQSNSNCFIKSVINVCAVTL
jgi:hypothetical protein